MRIRLLGPIALSFLSFTATAFAQEEPTPSPTPPPSSTPNASVSQTPPITPATPPKQWPALGGHFGFAIPIATLKADTTVIGRDFVQAGLTPGITLHLDDHWAIDFEFIAFNEMSSKNTPGAKTTFVVDPGVIRKFDGFVAGLRVATQVGADTNIGVVPIVVVPFKISERVSYFVEADVPLFLRDGGNKPEGSATFLFQSGFGF